MNNEHIGDPHTARPFVARTIHRFSAPIILAWLAITVIVSIAVPSLEQVEKKHLAALSPPGAPSFKAMTRMNEDFKESTSASFATIVLEGQQALGDEAHEYYNRLIRQLKNDPKHVRHIADFWGDPLTAAAAQSADGKAAYVQLNLAGNPGETSGDESVAALRDIVAQTPPPRGLQAYVTGFAPIITDMGKSGDRSIITITAVSLTVIFTMLFIVYRSVITVIVLLLMVGVELQVARGIVAFLGDHEIVGLSTYAVNLLVSIGIAAGTDYGIFFTGRYQEARQAGDDRETAYYTAYSGVAKVILASGLTIAGAVFCLSFTRLPSFQTLGVPCALGIFVAVAVALTLVPAVFTAASRFGLFDPKRKIQVRGWRRIGTVIVRWPVPILVTTSAIALVGLLTLPSYQPSYNDQKYIPKNIPANLGYTAASRHFTEARMMLPDVLLVEADHDMRNPTDFLVLNKLAKGIFAVPGISRVQAITRPEGTPLEHTTIPYLLSASNAVQLQTLKFQKDRMNDMRKQADEMAQTVILMRRMYSLMGQLVNTTHHTIADTRDVQAITEDLRDHLADFEDFLRPIRSYFYWEQHCYAIPICWSLRSIFDAFDGIDQISDKLQPLVTDLNELDLLMPQLLDQFPPMIETMLSMRIMLLTTYSTMSGTLDEMDANSDGATAMGKAFDAARNDDTFYIPPEVFNNQDFIRLMKIFLSPDGKAVRMLISHRGDPASPDGVSRVDAIRTAAEEALKGTPLEDAKIYLTGTAAVVKDLVDGSRNDLIIAGIAAFCLIFIIMLIITRSIVAAMVVVGTVMLSLGASFGLSVLVWQHIVGIQIHWVVLVMSVIILLAVGSDYNLLLVSRMKQEMGAGINTGIIRAMGGTGKVVTNAGLVFAFTMGSMVVSDLRTIGQVGTTIGIGLLFDTLIVRAFMTPSIAAQLGRWFWWPQKVRQRPASQLLRPSASLPLAVSSPPRQGYRSGDAISTELPRPSDYLAPGV